jgi:hypothetical protein
VENLKILTIKELIRKLCITINSYFIERPQLFRYTCVAFITVENRRQYLSYLRNQCGEDIERFEKETQKMLGRRASQLLIYLALISTISIVYGNSHFNYQRPFLSLITGVTYFLSIFLLFFIQRAQEFIQLIKETIKSKSNWESCIEKQIFEKKSAEGFMNKIKEQQRGVQIVVKGETVDFFLKDLLIIEYFLWMAKEKTALISFKVINKTLIGEAIYKKWEVRKDTKLKELLAKPKGKDFNFLENNIAKNRNGDAIKAKHKLIVDYFEENGFKDSKKIFSNHFFNPKKADGNISVSKVLARE